MKAAIIIISVIIVLIFVLFFKNRNKKSSNKTPVLSIDTTVSSLTGQMVTDTLDTLGYFKYTDPENLDTLKKEIGGMFDNGKVLTTINYEKPPYAPFCKRYYSCDGETLFELDGIVAYLKEIKPTFDKLNIPLRWSDDYFSDDATEHTIIINDKKYIAFKGDPDDLRAWGIATKNFVEILNDQLSIHNSEERVYPIMFNNDGRIIFLTKQQYDFISTYFDKMERPMEVNLWWETFK